MFGAVCFHSALTLQQRHTLELQQKRSLAIILGGDYRSYEHARSLTALPTLEVLREEACHKWALKTKASPKHRHLFPLNPSSIETRNRKECYGKTRIKILINILNIYSYRYKGGNHFLKLEY